MPNTGITVGTTYATQTGPLTLSSLDADFAQLFAFANGLINAGNFFVDSGAVNALAITAAAPLVATLAAGIPFQVKVGFTNMNLPATTPTLNVNGSGAKNILNPDQSNLTASQLRAGGIYSFMYDGTNFQLIGGTSGVQSGTSVRPMTGYTVIKPANTSRASTVALTNDPDLAITLNEIGTYTLEVFVMFNATTGGAGGFNCNTAYSGTTSSANYIQYAQVNGAFSQASTGGIVTAGPGGVSVGINPTTIIVGAAPPSVSDYATGIGQLVVTSVGTINFQWAQHASNVNAANVLAGSFMRAIRIG